MSSLDLTITEKLKQLTMETMSTFNDDKLESTFNALIHDMGEFVKLFVLINEIKDNALKIFEERGLGIDYETDDDNVEQIAKSNTSYNGSKKQRIRIMNEFHSVLKYHINQNDVWERKYNDIMGEYEELGLTHDMTIKDRDMWKNKYANLKKQVDNLLLAENSRKDVLNQMSGE
jgi:hypothetical protein